MADSINATPAARALAEEHGIDLSAVVASGATGIVVSDVETAVAARDGASASYELVGRDTYTLDTPQGKLSVRKGERIPARLFNGVAGADREHFSPEASE